MTALQIQPVASGIPSGGVDDGKDSASSASPAGPAVSEGQLSFPEVRPPVRIPPHLREKPLAILGLCKSAALEADWKLARWVEFKATADKCLTADALPEEMGLFMRVVKERFEVSD